MFALHRSVVQVSRRRKLGMLADEFASECSAAGMPFLDRAENALDKNNFELAEAEREGQRDGEWQHTRQLQFRVEPSFESPLCAHSCSLS